MGGLPSQGSGGTGTGTVSVDVTDKAARILGIVYGSLDQLQQRAVTKELLIQLRNAGVDIDPRNRNWNLGFSSDKVDISGSSVGISGTPDINITDRVSRLLGIIYGSQGQQIQQRGSTYELLVQLRDAGADVDPRQIRNLSSVLDSVNVPNIVTTTTKNRTSFTTRSFQNIGLAGVATQLSDITIPSGFALAIRATPGNTGSVYVATSAANTGVAASRITLSVGDQIKLFITNANLVFVAGSAINQNVDILVEQ